MAEQLRMGLIEQQQRAARTPYAGQPVAHWVRGGNESLPPPPDKPKAPRPAKQVKRTAAFTESEVDSVKELLAHGVAPKAISQQLGMSQTVISRIKRNKHPTKGGAPWKYSAEQRERAEALLLAGELTMGEIAECTGINVHSVRAMGTRLRQAPAAPAADQQPATPPAAPVRAAAVSTARMHVLDWGRRMAGYEFSKMPEQCKPRPSRAAKTYSPSQVQSFIRSNHSPSTGMDINARPRKSQPITNLRTKPRMLVQSLAQLFS